MKQIDTALLPALDALLQEASITRAARRLGLSKPTVSYTLGRLRDELGDPILVRSGRGMVLTPWAEELRPRVRALHTELRQVLLPREPVDLKTLKGEFSIRATDYVLDLLGECIDRYLLREAPGLRVRYVPNRPSDADDLVSGDVDLAVGIYSQLPSTLRSRILLTDEHVCVYRKGHPAINKRLSLQKYTELWHVQIAPRGMPGGYIDDLLRERGLGRTVVRAVPFFLPALEMVARSDFLLTTSSRSARLHASKYGLEVRPLPLPAKPYALSLVWHPRFDGDAGHKAVRAALLGAAREKAGDRHANARRHLR